MKLTRVNGRMISDGVTAVQAFEAGEVDVIQPACLPDEMSRLKETPEYEQYPALGTYYYGVNVKNITGREPARAMALAIPRQSLIDNVAQADQIPAGGFTPEGMPGFDMINPESPWLPAEGDMEQAKELMADVANPKTDITLYINDAPGHREIAVAIQAAWNELGIKSTIKQQEFQQYLSSSARRRTRTSTSTGSAGSATSSTRSTSSSCGRASRATTRRTTATRSTTS